MADQQEEQKQTQTEHATQTSQTVLTQTHSSPANAPTTNIRDYNPMRTSMTQDYASYTPTYMDIYQKNHRYHGFPEYHMMRSHKPITARDAEETAKLEPKTNANIPYGENVPITQTDPRPFQGALQERSSAEHRKFRRHQLEAENDILKYKEEKLKQLQMEREEKKRDMEMLKSYDPYGKPGGGAPMLDGPKKNKFPNDPPNHSYSNEAGFKFGRPGAGAPLRTDSGRIRTEITGDPLIRFHQGQTLQAQQAIKESIRYVTKKEEGQNYQKQLDQQLAERAVADQEARMHELKADIDMMVYDPYGKPGAGAPNRKHDRDLHLQYRSPKHEDIWHPFGRGGHGAPIKDQNGNPVTVYGRPKRQSEPETYPFKEQTPDSSRNGGAGAPIIADGETQARLPMTMKRNEFGDSTIKEQIPGKAVTDRESQIWHPFGKAGAGAPLVDKKGNNITTVYGKMYHDRDSADERRKQRAARDYLNEIQQEMIEQKRNRDAERDYNRAPVGELARVIQEGQVGRPRRDPYTGLLTDQHLGMSDVTKHRLDHRSQKNDASNNYHTELSRAADERYRNRELEKLKERQRSHMHQQVMDSFWGRPGGGAPNPTGARYHDPIEMIHSPRRQSEAPQWEHTKDLSHVPKPPTTDKVSSPRASYDSPYKFKVRDTTHSTHKNQYEYESPREPVPKKSYNLISPYALA